MSQVTISTNDILFFSRYKNVDPTDRTYVKAMKFDKPAKYHPVKWTSHFLTAFHKLLVHYRATLCELLPGHNIDDHLHHSLGISRFIETRDLDNNESVGEGCLLANAPSATSDRVHDSTTAELLQGLQNTFCCLQHVESNGRLHVVSSFQGCRGRRNRLISY